MRNFRSVASIAVVLLATVLTSCAGTAMAPATEPSSSPSLSELATSALGGLSGVVSVALTSPSIDHTDGPTPTPGPADYRLDVTVAEAATIDEIVAVAQATADFSHEYAEEDLWVSFVGVENIDHEPDDDMPSQSPAVFEVFPNVRVSAGEDAREIMDLLALPEVEQVSVTEGFPQVTVTQATGLAAARAFASGLVLWRNGGAIWAEDGRVRLMDVPERLTNDGMDAIIATSITYPTAQFWLEAAKVGPRWPRLYIDHVSDVDAAGITAALTDPALGDAMVNDYELEFVIRANSADGATVDNVGVVGPPS